MLFHQPSNSTGGYNAFFYTDTMWDFHFHKNFELICVVQGKVRCTVNGQTYMLGAGEFGLCLAYEIHAYTPMPDTRYFVCVFSADYVRAFAKLTQGKQGSRFTFTCDAAVADFLRTYLITENTPPLFLLKSCLYAACAAYTDSVELVEQERKKMQMMNRITDYVQENHTKKITLSDIAELLGYDYHYISRSFQSVFNMSFVEFLNLYRMETAVKLLDETDKKMVDIAYESGFQSVRSFNNCFKMHMGISPSEYKKVR